MGSSGILYLQREFPHRARRGARGWVWAVAVACAVGGPWCCGAAEAGGAGPAAETLPDLVVMVVVSAEGPEEVALSYAHLVNHQGLRRGIEQLGASTGTEISGVVIEDKPMGRGLPEVGTSAEFAAGDLVKADGRPLPVMALAEALPEWERMRLAFMVGEELPFPGPRTQRQAGLSVGFLGGRDVYEYDVVRMNGESGSGVESTEVRPGGRELGAGGGRRPVVRGPAETPASERAQPMGGGVAVAGGVLVVVGSAWLVMCRRRRSVGRMGAAPTGGEAAGERGVGENGSNRNGT